MRHFFEIVAIMLLVSSSAFAAQVKTNAVVIPDAPKWVTSARVEKIVQNIQRTLEWDIRRVQVVWYHDQKEFEKVHGFGPAVLAISRKADNTVRIGPRVTDANFDGVFGHELVHVIVYQKYHDAIPKWLEEGLANFLSGRGAVDYKWLASKPLPKDVRELVHPFAAGGQPVSSEAGMNADERAQYHYIASRALVEMISSHCDLHDLLGLAVGKSVESYLPTYCEIPDINAEFKKWIDTKKGF